MNTNVFSLSQMNEEILTNGNIEQNGLYWKKKRPTNQNEWLEHV